MTVARVLKGFLGELMPTPTSTNISGLRDNHTRGSVAEFLKAKIQPGSRLSVVSAYFTIYAYDALKDCLDNISHLDFLFGEPTLINRLDPSKTEKKAFIIDGDGLELANRLHQKRVAKECADWIERKVDIKTIKQSNLLHGKMYHVAINGVEDAILGSSNFTVRGLGLSDGSSNIELNLIVDSRDTSRQAQTQFTNWAKRPPGQRKTRELIAAIGGDFFKLLDGLSIARSRSQIANYYASEMQGLGGFPQRPAPKAIHAPIDLKQRFLSFEDLDAEIDGLRLALYHPTSKLRDDLPEAIRTTYQAEILGGFTQEGRERILIAMMKVNFLKRLESSVDSFRLTLQRTIDKIDQLEKRISAFEKHLDANPDLDYDSLTPDQFEDPDFDEEDFTIGGRRRIHLAHLKLPEWLKEVRNDRTQLQFLLEKTQSVTVGRDGKLAELKALIEAKVRRPTINRDGKANRKVLVFTAFADTARYLHEHLDLCRASAGAGEG